MLALKFNGRSLISPLGIVRLLEIFFSCTAFSLAATYKDYGGNYGSWSMFTWCFCFIVSVFVVIMELISLDAALPVSWQDFTSAFSMLATLMIFTTSVVYPATFIPSCQRYHCGYQIGATIMSCLCFIAYAVEVGLTRAKAGELSNFLTTIPGLLKVFEAYVACLIFSLLGISDYKKFPGLEWCVAVYCICFILTMVIIILTIGRCLGSLPIPVEKTLIAYNILAVLMYLTVVVVWPLYSFRDNPRPRCNISPGRCVVWDNDLGITFLSFFNLIAYIVDFAYSYKMVFVTTPA
ncbi:myeloid-associated differentiation marker-like [Pantherophis guttatus]|uniref:Myeloid-associated differentiation marker-like n=1 Tax=Pantherophis guttatus TaxID=94885 RepID=A0A6P9C907_PANGU|nr:myeloid-associated differentiation marker-like [Pantherophis guttatus]